MKISLLTKKKHKFSEAEFETLYKTYYARLYAYSFQFITDEEAVKDIVSDVFEKIWKQKENIKTETLAAFLYTLVRNQCMDYLRHKKTEQEYVMLYEQIPQEDPEEAEQYEARLTSIEKIISELGEPTKSIFTECYFHNKKYAEVAQEYHMSSSGVKKHIMKVLRLIRAEFDLRK